ncbi:MAG TPA: nucleotidyltransferase [Thermoanaerobaculia bacterium]|nr:nucleotidyltransferase [Thermoanaerobaculia bacterium]
MSSRDYEEFLASLNAHGVRYLLVGAHAVALHARPRATKDLDVLVAPTRDNAERVLAAIRDYFGGADLAIMVSDLTTPERVVQLGVAPARIDLLSSLSSVRDFEAAWERRVDARFGSVDAHYIGLDDLIAEKESAGRDQDRADARSLRAARSRRG